MYHFTEQVDFNFFEIKFGHKRLSILYSNYLAVDNNIYHYTVHDIDQNIFQMVPFV